MVPTAVRLVSFKLPEKSPCAPLPMAREAAPRRDNPVSVAPMSSIGTCTAATPVLPVWAKVRVLVSSIIAAPLCITFLAVQESVMELGPAESYTVPDRVRIGEDWFTTVNDEWKLAITAPRLLAVTDAVQVGFSGELAAFSTYEHAA